MNEWVMPYQSEFKNWISELNKNKQPKEKGLQPHQSFVKNYLKDGPFRGVMLYHGLGTGKTRSSIAICEGRGKDTIILLPASIKENFQSEIKKYIEDSDTTSTIKYDYIHYNGLTRNRVSEIIKDKKFFENKTVVIDELHNFISMVKNGSQNAKRIYSALLECDKVVIVALTGTPILNTPEELGYIFNLLYGAMKTHSITVKKHADAKLLELQKNHQVSQARLLDNQATIEYTMYPDGFVRSETKPHTLIRGEHDPKLNTKNPAPYLMFPAKPEHFRNYFVSDEGIKNKKMFTRRVQGIVSHYQQNETNTDYPVQEKLKIVKCEMTDHQFQTYSKMRNVEISLELNRSNKNGDSDAPSDKKEPSLYKTYTRACCNFVFPNSIPRPFSKQKVMNEKEIDDDDADYDDIVEDDTTVPPRVLDIKETLALLNKSDFLSDPNKLKHCSPKMLQILNRIHFKKSKGPVVVYSAFRNVEGVGIFTMLLRKFGFVELSIKTTNGVKILENAGSSSPKYIVFTSNMETNRVLMDIFNNDLKNVPEIYKSQLPENFTNLRGEYAKVILLTKSGSEGISLKNVRQVHILEPYWNDIRVKQVIGRAVRAGSHAALPQNERKVKSFIYLTHFTQSQIDSNKTILIRDGGFTTDENIYKIAEQKAKINDSFLKLMRNTSIDCHIFNPGKCVNPVATKDGLLYPLGPIEKDSTDNKIQSNVKKTNYQYLTYESKEKPGTFKKKSFMNPLTGIKEALMFDDNKHALYFQSTVDNANANDKFNYKMVPDFVFDADKIKIIPWSIFKESSPKGKVKVSK